MSESIELTRQSKFLPPQPQSLYEFVSNTPPTVTRLVVEFQPLIATSRWIAQVVSWKSGKPTESWLALGYWWAFCVSLQFGLRYLLPVVVVLPFAIKWVLVQVPFLRQFFPTNPQIAVANEDTVASALADVHTLQSLLPKAPEIPALPPYPTLARIIGASYALYILITFLVPYHILVALAGTGLLTWRSPWFRASRRLLWKSGWVRWATHRSWMLVSGLKPSGEFIAPSPTIPARREPEGVAEVTGNSDPLATAPPPAVVRFRFTVLENQRWWMGLDWTAALLPSERPSWCSAPPLLTALPPPSSLSLPGPTTVFLPLPETEPSAFRQKRTAKWRWEENEWGVVVQTTSKDGTTTKTERVTMDVPKVDYEAGSASRIVDAVGKGLRRANGASTSSELSSSKDSITGTPSHSQEPSSTNGEHSPNRAKPQNAIDDHGLTDRDGWIYADNKWEGGTPKAGLGKYTRYRRWTRVAILEETVELVPGDPSATPTSPKASSSKDLAPITNGAASSLGTSLRQRLTTK